LLGLNIGDECTIQYVLDSTDHDPHPLVGRYFGTNAVIRFANITIVGNPNSGGNLTVKTGRPGLSDLVAYQNGGPNYGVQISFAFPEGTITSDALPLELPLAQATTSYFDVYPSFDPILVGRIMAYSSAEVPEPYASSTLVLVLTGTCARKFGRDRSTVGRRRLCHPGHIRGSWVLPIRC
jgi:hypothetical protein